MKYNQDRKLGKTGPDICPIGFGAMSLTNFYGPCNDMQADKILNKVLDLGINHIDTSNVYGAGTSESRIGEFLAKQGKQKNNLFFIATKAAICRDPETGVRSFNNTERHLEEELDKSLVRLGIDSIDLFYIHRRDPKIPIEEVTESLVKFIKKGKIKSIGFSEIAPTSLKRASKIHHIAAVQSEYSLSTRSPEMGLVQECKNLGTALVAFSPVGRSFLTDSPLSYDVVKELDFTKNNLHVVGYSTPVNQEMSLEELDNHLHSLPEQPDAIPYVTSYYKKNWGFCLQHEQRKNLKGNLDFLKV